MTNYKNENQQQIELDSSSSSFEKYARTLRILSLAPSPIFHSSQQLIQAQDRNQLFPDMLKSRTNERHKRATTIDDYTLALSYFRFKVYRYSVSINCC